MIIALNITYHKLSDFCMSKRNKCPLCKQETSAEFQPFCSRGCRDKDLLKWFGEDYAVAGEPAVIADVEPDGFE